MPPGIQPPVAGNPTIATTPRTPGSRTLSDALAALPDLSNKIIKSHAPYCGVGAFSDVYRRQYDTGADLIEVAVKSFRFSFALDETKGESAKSTTIRKMIRRELGVWGRLKHPNIVPFLGIAYGFGKERNASLVSIWMVNGTLHDFLEKHDLDDRLTIAHRLQLLLDIGNGINYLHSFPFVHGDLTCNNVLLDHNYNALLADFGYTSMVGDIPEAVRYLQMSTVRPGTLRWAAPEHFTTDEQTVKHHTTKSDIYSFGNLALLVLSGKQPWWEVKREEAVIIQLSRGNRPKRPLDRPIDNHHWELIERCWSSVNERPSAHDIVSFLQHTLHALPLPSTIRQVFHVDPMTTSSTDVRDDPSNDMRVAEDYVINIQDVIEETARKSGDAAGDVPDGISPILVKLNTDNRQNVADAQHQPTNMYNRPRPNPQLIAIISRFVFMSAQDMRAHRVPEQLITFVDRHRAELLHVYQHRAKIMATKRSAEQKQQSVANTQDQPPDVPKMHDLPFLGLPPGVPRPPPIGANAMDNVGESEMANGSFLPDSVPTLQKEQQPTQDQIQRAVAIINQCKLLFRQRALGVPPKHIPEEQRPEYNRLIEQVFKITSELEPKLPLYLAVFKNDEVPRRYVPIVMTVARQRQLLNSNSPQYIISLGALRTIRMQVLQLNEEFKNRWFAITIPGVTATMPMPQPHAQSSQMRPRPPRSVTPPGVYMTSSSAPPSLPSITSRIPPSATAIAPSPTHVTDAPTPQPTHSSPQTPESPPSNAVGKATSRVRKMPSTSKDPATSAPTPQPTYSSPRTPESPPNAICMTKAPSRARKLSSASKDPVTPEWAPFVIGVKRPPEGDTATFTSVTPSEVEVNNAPSSLKKAKTGRAGEPSEALAKKRPEAENIMIDDNAIIFFDRMEELLPVMTSSDGEIHHDLASTLDQILAGVAQGPADAAAAAIALSVHGAGVAGPPPDALLPHISPSLMYY